MAYGIVPLSRFCPPPVKKEMTVDLLTYIYVQRRIDPSLRISASDMEYIKTVVSGERIFTKHLEENRELHNCRVEDGTHGSSRITARLRVVGRKSAVDGAVINLRICVSFHSLRVVLDNLRDFFCEIFIFRTTTRPSTTLFSTTPISLSWSQRVSDSRSRCSPSVFFKKTVSFAHGLNLVL